MPPLDASQRRRAWMVAALALWALGLAIVAVRVTSRPEKNSVYPLFHQTGLTWRDGGDLYAHVGEFRYSPTVAAAFAGLSFLPQKVGQMVWLLLNVGVLAAGWHRWSRKLSDRWQDWEPWAVLLLLIPLVLGNFNNLQSNPLVLGLMLLACAEAVDARWWHVSAWIALAAALKLYPLALGLCLLPLAPWALGWRLSVAMAAAALLPLACQDLAYVKGQYHDWIGVLGQDSRLTLDVKIAYKDLSLLWRHWFGPPDASSWRLVQGISSVCVFGVSAWAAFVRPRAAAAMVAIMWVTLWILLLGPSTESATYMLAVPAVILLLDDHGPGRRERLARGFGWAGFAVLVFSAMLSWFPFGSRVKGWGFQVGAGMLLAIGAAFWMPSPRARLGVGVRDGGAGENRP